MKMTRFEPRLIALQPKEYGIWDNKEGGWENICKPGYKTKIETEIECRRLNKLYRLETIK